MPNRRDLLLKCVSSAMGGLFQTRPASAQQDNRARRRPAGNGRGPALAPFYRIVEEVIAGEWLTEQGRFALPKSPIGQAIAYAQSNWAALCRYPEHGGLSIDNNLAERMLRAQALGRKNWTFLGSDRGGRTAAVLYSFTGTCRHQDMDPFAYLTDILRRLPSLPAQRLDELMPDAWFASHPSARRKRSA